MKVIHAPRLKGFSHVEETASALETVWRERARALEDAGGSLISNCCPGVMELVNARYPEAIPSIAG